MKNTQNTTTATEKLNILPVGSHTATVKSYLTMRFEPNADGTKKTDRIKVSFNVGPDNHAVYYTGYLTSAAMPYVKRALEALGYTSEKRETFKKDVIGNIVTVDVIHEVGADGVTRAKVSFIHKLREFVSDDTAEFYNFMEEQF